MYGSVRLDEKVPDSNSRTDEELGAPAVNSGLSRFRGVMMISVLLLLTTSALFLVIGGAANSNRSIAGVVSSLNLAAESSSHLKDKHTEGNAEDVTANMDRPEITPIVAADGAYPDFHLLSTVVIPNATLPDQFSCLGSDGGHNPPFHWTGVPPETKSFAFIFHSRNHWDWGLFNIPVTQTSIPEGCSYPDQRDFFSCGAPVVGSYPDKAKYYYDPPCSEGPGSKTYYWVVYALSETIYPEEQADSGDDANHFDYEFAGFNVYDLMTKMANITIATSTVMTPFTHYTGGLPRGV